VVNLYFVIFDYNVIVDFLRQLNHILLLLTICRVDILLVAVRDVTDPESDGIQHFPKSEICRILEICSCRIRVFVSVQLYNYFHK